MRRSYYPQAVLLVLLFGAVMAVGWRTAAFAQTSIYLPQVHRTVVTTTTAPSTSTTIPPGACRDCIAFENTTQSGQSAIWLIHSDGTGLRQITFGLGDRNPAWSPDSNRLAFDRGGQIWIVGVNGQLSETQITQSGGSHPSWSPDGIRIAYINSYPSAVWVTLSNGYGAHAICGGIQGTTSNAPAWMPAGSQVAFSRQVEFNPTDIWMCDVDSGQMTQVTNTADHSENDPATAAGGQSLAVSGGSIFTASPDFGNKIWVVDLGGGTAIKYTTGSSSVVDWQPTWSPDGSRIAFGSRRGTSDIYFPKSNIWIQAGTGGVPFSLTGGTVVADHAENPAWSRH